VWLSITYLLQGLLGDARHYAEQAFTLVPSPLFMGTLAGVARRGGDQERAGSLIVRLKDGPAPGTSIGFALYHLMCLEFDEALQYLEEAVARRDAMAMLPVLFRRFCAPSPRWLTAARTLNLPG
jgi:hypothetical protein